MNPRKFSKRIFLKAYAKANLGDDLFIDFLLRRYPNVQFVIECERTYENIYRSFNNLVLVSPSSGRLFLEKTLNKSLKHFSPAAYKLKIKSHYKKLLADTDGMLVLGGSVFMQESRARNDSNIAFYRLATDIMKSKPVFFLGCNFGPFYEDEYKSMYHKIFSRARDVSFREKYSFELFKDINCVRFHPDIILGYEPNVQSQREPNSVGFSIVPASKAGSLVQEKAYIDSYTRIISSFLETGCSVKLFSFCKKEGDEGTIERIYLKLSTTHQAKKVFYRGNINEFLKEYSSVESVFCGRFHSLILSMIFNQKILPVAYSEKMTNMLNDIGYSGRVLNLVDLTEYQFDFIKDLLHGAYDILPYRKQAAHHFKKLDEFLVTGA